MEDYGKIILQIALKKRLLFESHLEQLGKLDILIFHCPLDLIIMEKIDKSCIFYDHRAGRLTTFMFNEIAKRTDPLRAEIMKRDRKWVIERLKKLYAQADVILVNSGFIKKQLKKYFGFDSFVVNPPVDINYFKPRSRSKKKDYFFSIQRVNWQKRIEIQIKAFAGLEQKLVIAGSNADRKPNEDLKELCEGHDNIKYVGWVSERKLRNLYSQALATIQTGFLEDFGLVPIESMACGTPVIVVNEGGFRETVHSSNLGIRIKPPYVKNLRKTVQHFNSNNFNSELLRKESEKYGFERFKNQMGKYVKLAVKKHAEKGD